MEVLMKHVELTNQCILITGAAGFIGSHLCLRLLNEIHGVKIIALDNMNAYYDIALKEMRLERLKGRSGFTFVKGDLADKEVVLALFETHRPQIVVNLGAQAGVRYSIKAPDAYISSNITGFFNILEACRQFPVEHLVYASSSSVYGNGKQTPYRVDDKADCPVSLYAATKKSNELMAHAYSALYGIPVTGLRFFTVYGPFGRPDMAYFSFTEKLLRGENIRIFNYGSCMRDFTYIDDTIEGVIRVMGGAPCGRSGGSYALYNIGKGHPESLLDFVDTLQRELVRAGLLPGSYDFEAHRELVPMQPGDVVSTCADTAPLERDFGYRPSTSLETGLRCFAEWYRDFYRPAE